MSQNFIFFQNYRRKSLLTISSLDFYGTSIVLLQKKTFLHIFTNKELKKNIPLTGNHQSKAFLSGIKVLVETLTCLTIGGMANNRQTCEDIAVFGLLLLLMAKFLLSKRFSLKYHIKFGFAYFSALVITGFWLPVFLFNPRNTTNLRKIRSMAGWLGWILGVRYNVRHGNFIEKDKPAVLVCNHQSTLDVLALMNVTDLMDAFTVIAKRALLFIWPFGPCAWLAGTIFVDRKNPVKSYRTIAEAKSWLKQNPACKYWFFAEGTRNQNVIRTRSLLPFKKGAFRTAIACQLPIIPVVNSPYYFVNKSKCFFSRGTVITEILSPISTTGLTQENVDALMEKTQNLMQRKYEKLFTEIESTLPEKYPGLL